MVLNAARFLLRTLNRIEEYVLFLMVFQMGVSIFVQVVMRYVFLSAVTWLDELVHIEVIFLTFFGASLGIKYGAHISVDILKNVVRKDPYRSLLEAFNHLVTGLYAGFIIYFGMKLIGLMTTRVHYTPTLRIPKHYLYFVVCLGLALIGVRSAIRFFQSLAALRPKGKGEEVS
jgi:TRAP-type C4-dicarboxylate transport system permease small subunit